MSEVAPPRKRFGWGLRTAVAWLLAVTVTPLVAHFEHDGRNILRSFTERLVTGLDNVEPTFAAQYFSLQVVHCNFDLGFRCAPEGVPRAAVTRPERPTLDRSDAASVGRAHAAMRSAFWPPTHWVTTVFSTPGALVATARLIARQGWPVWASFAVAFIIALALIVPIFDTLSFAALAVWPFVAAGVAWILFALIRALGGIGWESQFMVYLGAAGTAVIRLVHLAHNAHQFEEVLARRWKGPSSSA